MKQMKYSLIIGGVLILASSVSRAGDLTANTVTIKNKSGPTFPTVTWNTDGTGGFASDNFTVWFDSLNVPNYSYMNWNHESTTRYLTHRWRTGNPTYSMPVVMDLFAGGSTGEAAKLTLFKLDSSDPSSQTKGVNLNAGGNSWLLGGNLGIGTDSPAKTLELKASSSPAIRLNETGVNPQAAFWFGANRNTANNANYLLWYSESSTSPAHYVFSGAGGSAPGYLMEVEGGGSTSDHGRIKLYPANDSFNASVKISSGGDSYLNGGKLGVGTTSPAEQLDVVGKAKLSDALKLTPRTSAPSSPSAGDIYCNNSSGTYTLKFYDGAAWKTVQVQ